MRQRWEDVTFLHWRVSPRLVAPLLPPSLRVDTLEGAAWVGLVPFHMVEIGPTKGPPIPYLGTFPETNVRTYVDGPDGPGVWFHSLEAARLIPVVVARLGYRLPYFHAAMRFEQRADIVTYTTVRRWPGPAGVGGSTTVRVGGRIQSPTTLDNFLTARWRLYSMARGRLVSAEVRHEAWPLYRAEPLAWDGELIEVTGYPAPVEAPHALFSTGVGVEVYRPTRVPQSPAGHRA